MRADTIPRGPSEPGDEPSGARERFELLYADLHERAELLMRRQRSDHTLQATALVNEAWLRVRGAAADGAHSELVRRATCAMRTVLVDHARGNLRDKRGGGARDETLGSELLARSAQHERLLELRETLERLRATDADLARVAELRVVGGLEHHEIARALGVSTRTIERAWASARAWLVRELETSRGDEASAA